MKTLRLSKKIFVLISLVAALAWPAIAPAGNYNYADLQMKNFEEMQNRIKARVKKAEDVAGSNPEIAKVILKDALQLLLSRPNGDNMVSQLVPPIRTMLKNLEAYEPSLKDIVSSMIKEVTNKKQKPNVRATSLIVLNNLMSETKPEIKNNPEIRKIFTLIRDAKLEVADDVKGEMHLRAMLKAPASPSDIAEKILEEKK